MSRTHRVIFRWIALIVFAVLFMVGSMLPAVAGVVIGSVHNGTASAYHRTNAEDQASRQSPVAIR